MAKTLTLKIRNCDGCPNFDNEYYSYNEECSELGRKITEYDETGFKIPDDCPLKDDEADA